MRLKFALLIFPFSLSLAYCRSQAEASGQQPTECTSTAESINLPGGSKELEKLFSAAVKVGNTVYLSGQIGLDPKTKELGETFAEQVQLCLSNLQAVLKASGGSVCSMVRTTVLLTDIANYDAMNKVYEQFFSNVSAKPARAAYAVQALPLKALVEIEAVAVLQ